MDQDRRRATRHFFSAQAEILEPSTTLRVSSRVGELSLHGCYLDMMNPFPPETLVKLKITAGNETFHADTRIVYSTPNVGSGAAFLDVASQDQVLLERWLQEAGQ